MNHLSLGSDPQREIETRVKLASAAFASGLATGAGHRDQRANQEGLFMEKLGQAGAGLALLLQEVGAMAHRGLLSI